MVKRRIQLSEDVITMARKRILNIFQNGLPVYFSVSGGKDSIVLSHLIYSMIREGTLDPKQLTVNFIDEEAMHDEVIRITQDWRTRFQKVGARFRWWCVEVKHFNCFNSLSQEETFICWDRRMRDRWVRERPKFAITDHEDLRPHVDTYQEFLARVCRDGITITGVRVAESLQRLTLFREKPLDPRMQKPIYDWRDTDVWRYIRDHGLDFPETYLHLYQIGVGRRGMRLSQFFSVDTAKVLVRLGEYDHDLMERVTRREPNAYLASLYWDSEMFRGGARKMQRAEDEAIDWRARGLELLASPKHAPFRRGDPNATVAQRNARYIRGLIKRAGGHIPTSAWREIVGILEGGDPKQRSIRALYTKVGKVDPK